MSFKSGLASIASNMGVLDGYTLLRKSIYKSHIIILIYHRIAPKEDIGFLKPLNPKIFEKQIEYLKQNYNIISLPELQKLIKNKCIPKEKTVIITIDDGYKDNYLYAYPIFKRYNVPATIFLSTGNIEHNEPFWCDEVSALIHLTSKKELKLKGFQNYDLTYPHNKYYCINNLIEKIKRYDKDERIKTINNLIDATDIDIPDELNQLVLSWNDVKKMNGNVINFGAHTVTHTILTNSKLEDAMCEISGSKEIIEDYLGSDIDTFSYPNGTYDDFNCSIANLVKKAGFTCAVTTIPSLITSKSNLFTLGRINGSINDFNNFRVITSGIYADYRRSLHYRYKY
jgi:peptidoglycan/xylan/chitin deacetylase (PgdA/CDA1 family)